MRRSSGRGTAVGGRAATASSRSRREALTPAEQTSLTEAAHARRSTPRSSVQNVSASFGRQIAEGAILAILVSLLLVAIYISFRFQPKFARAR